MDLRKDEGHVQMKPKERCKCVCILETMLRRILDMHKTINAEIVDSKQLDRSCDYSSSCGKE